MASKWLQSAISATIIHISAYGLVDFVKITFWIKLFELFCAESIDRSLIIEKWFKSSSKKTPQTFSVSSFFCVNWVCYWLYVQQNNQQLIFSLFSSQNKRQIHW